MTCHFIQQRSHRWSKVEGRLACQDIGSALSPGEWYPRPSFGDATGCGSSLSTRLPTPSGRSLLLAFNCKFSFARSLHRFFHIIISCLLASSCSLYPNIPLRVIGRLRLHTQKGRHILLDLSTLITSFLLTALRQHYFAHKYEQSGLGVLQSPRLVKRRWCCLMAAGNAFPPAEQNLLRAP